MNTKRILRPVKVPAGYPERLVPVYVTIEVRGEGPGRELSITAVEGPRANGDCVGSCGQARELDVREFAEGWTPEMVAKLREVWDRWHLNQMRAGSKAQEDYLRAHPVTFAYPQTHFEEAGKALTQAGLNPDAEGHKYGHAWKFEELPQEVVDWLDSLPATLCNLPGQWA